MAATARQCAAELLRSVLDEKRPLDETCARHASLAQLAERDRAFARLLTMTVLRRLGQIDALLAGLLQKPLSGKTTDVLQCLRLGAVQLLWLGTPAHAAVHAMVEATAALGHARMTGLVNAVLKRLAKEGADLLAKQDEAALNLPAWLYASWAEAYGEPTARAIALARLAEPPLDLTVKDDAAGWARRLGGMMLPTGSVRLARAGRIEELAGYIEGDWWVQDAAASLPVQVLGEIGGAQVLDLCAAPGGKTAQLAARGALVTAVDKSSRRLDLLKANLSRLRLAVRTVEADILRFSPEENYDAVVLDAPCTATGTLRRHPEVVWARREADVAELASLQRRLLNRAARWVLPGGRLVYCVCSLQPEEGEMQAEQFQRAHPDFVPLPVPAERIAGAVSGNLGLRTHPACLAAQGGMDGFYMAGWQRLNNP